MKHEYYTCDRCGRKVDIAYRLYAVGGDESKPLADIDLCSDCLYEVKDLITRPVDQTEKVPAPAAEAVAAPPSEEIGKPSTASARDSENSAYNTAAEAAPADTASSEPSSHETDVTCYDASTSKEMTKLAKELAASTEKHEKEHPREGHGQQKHGLSKVKHYKAAPFDLEKAKQLRAEGNSYGQIALALGTVPNKVGYYLRRYSD